MVLGRFPTEGVLNDATARVLHASYRSSLYFSNQKPLAQIVYGFHPRLFAAG